MRNFPCYSLFFNNNSLMEAILKHCYLILTCSFHLTVRASVFTSAVTSCRTSPSLALLPVFESLGSDPAPVLKSATLWSAPLFCTRTNTIIVINQRSQQWARERAISQKSQTWAELQRRTNFFHISEMSAWSYYFFLVFFIASLMQ